MLSGINHVGIAVRDLEQSITLFRTLLGVEPTHRETVSIQRVEVASFQLGTTLLELTAPIGEDSPIAKFIEKRGEGIHHVAFTTDNAHQELMRLSADGFQLIDREARPGAHSAMVAFLHPKSTGGVLVELCQPPATTNSD
jgi:methylmalonyl-CoA/ethylmalonyl-CoA epimerase